MFQKLVLAAAVVAAVPAAARDRDDPDAQLAKLLAGRVAGRPVRCINPRDATNTIIVEGRAIVYRIGARLFVNRPQGGVERLRDDDILVTNIRGGQLCRPEPVNLVDRASGIGHGFVLLGDFVPYARPSRRR